MMNPTLLTARPRIIAAMALALTLAPAAAQAEKLSLVAKARVFGATVMTVKLDANYAGKAYTASAAIIPSDMLARMGGYFQNFSIRGARRGVILKPLSFSMRIRPGNRNVTHKTALIWKSLPRAVSAPPFMKPHDAAIRRVLTRATFDPLSMFINTGNLGGVCKGRFRAYDGFKVYDLALKPLGRATYAGAQYRGPVVKCRATLHQYAGSPSSANGKSAHYTAWIVPVKTKTAGLLLVPVKVTGQLSGFNFTAYLHHFSYGGRSLRQLAGH